MFVAVTSANVKLTVKPPCTAAGEVTVKVITEVPALPSVIVGLVIVNALVSRRANVAVVFGLFSQ